MNEHPLPPKKLSSDNIQHIGTDYFSFREKKKKKNKKKRKARKRNSVLHVFYG